jgi:hypothetical protein
MIRFCIPTKKVSVHRLDDDAAIRSKKKFTITMTVFGVVLVSGLLVMFSAVALALLLWIVMCRIKFQRRTTADTKMIAFFHPHCSAGGGGERVLWKAIQVLGELHEQGFPLSAVIYTIDEPKASYKKGVYLSVVHMRSCCTVQSSHFGVCLVPLLRRTLQCPSAFFDRNIFNTPVFVCTS